MTEQMTEQMTEERQAELIQAFIKTREAAASAKASLDDEKKRLTPYEEAKRSADKEHAEAKAALREALAEPGAKFATGAGVARLSNPKTTIVRELDVDAFIEHMREKHPKMVEKYVRDVAKTPVPSLTVKDT